LEAVNLIAEVTIKTKILWFCGNKNTCKHVYYIKILSYLKWSVYRQSVRTNNDVEGNNLYTSLVCNDHNLFKAYVLKKTTLQQTYVY
jgi:hypothetical protein